MNTQRKKFSERCRDLWHYFTLYEKIWFFSIIILAVIFSFLFPETDDPTYTVNVAKDAYSETSQDAEFGYLDFSGTEDTFVITGVTINGKEYSVSEFTSAQEYTVTPSEGHTLMLELPEKIKAGDTLAFECYADGDETLLTVSIVDESGNALLEKLEADIAKEASFADYSVTENAPRYLVSVQMLMVLYLLDVITNIACELLISKQSKWNFAVSLVVEVVEILICIVCMYRFATMVVTLLFWIPCDIISFFAWHKNRDTEQEELTVVKTLTPLQDVFLVIGIVVWTVVVGYLLTFIEVEGGIFANNVVYKNVACYLDACASAVGIANGLFILFRYREQWIAWYICAIIETVINIMAGQYVLLILKAGYITNTTYGYIKWTKYIKSHKNKPSAKLEKAKA